MPKSEICNSVRAAKRLSILIAVILMTVTAMAQPAVNSFSPLSGPVGSAVTISGSNFSSTPANNTVYFGPVKATVTSATASSLTVTVPAGATCQSPTVTVNGLTAYAARQFNVTFSGGGQINGSTYQNRFDSITDLHPNLIIVADFDGDGKPDMATPNNFSTTGQPASVSVLRNTSAAGNISFAPVQNLNNGVQTYSMAAGDIDGDGKLDIISSSIVDKNVSVFRNTSTSGNISFAPKVDFSTNTDIHGITLADFDNDGKTDIAAASFISAAISVFRNTSSPGTVSFAPKVDIASAGTESITSSDFDGDGKTDFATTNNLLGIFSIYRNTGTAGTISFAARTDIPCGGSNQPYGITCGDIDSDGKNDLAVVITNSSISGVQLYRNLSTAGNISFSYTITLAGAANTTGYHAALGDVNGDGKPDVAMTYASGSGQARVFQNNSTSGNISFGTGSTFNALFAPYGVAICDLDADSKPELSVSEFNLNKVSVFKNYCGTPEVSSFSPTAAAAGATITVTGSNFTGVSAVSFGGIPATSFNILNSTNLTAVVGTGASGDVSVTNNIGTGSKSGFVFQGAPVITSFNPQNGFSGTLVTIHGFNFNNASAVSFGGTAAQGFTVVDPFTIDATVASGSSGNVSVTTTFGTGSLAGFSYTPIPVISSFTPTSAGTGTTVTISGINFTGSTNVSFGGVNATSFTIVNNNSITAVVGNGASGNIVVTNSFGNGSIPGFSYIPPPVITSFSPVSAGAGTTITINGSNFTNASVVKFGGVNANSFTVVNAGTITAVVSPSGASGAVTVTTPGGTATLAGFNFIPAPGITSFSPAITGTGGIVTITGTSFTGTTAVSFGGTPATSFTVIDANTITAVVGTGTSGNVSVTTPGGSGSLGGFIFITTPYINTFSPASGPIGTTVTITGANFSPVAANNIVYFGAVKASINSATANTLVVTVPTGATYQPITVSTSNLTAYSARPFKVTYAGGGAFTAGSFSGRTDFVTAGQPESIASGDLDGDGKADVVVANAYSNSISIFRNTSTAGALSFAPKIDSAAGLYPHAVKIADINGDGKLDIIYLNYNTATTTAGPDNTISIFRNISTPGTLAFAARITFLTTNGIVYVNPWSMTIADFNIDGKPDLAVTHSNTYMPNGNPFYTTYVNTSTPSAISFLGAQVNEISIFPNQVSPSSIASADFNLDAKPDLVVTTAQGTLAFNRVAVVVNQSTIGITNIALSPGIINTCTSTFNYAYATDFDGDGKPDILTENCFYRNTTATANNVTLVSQATNGLGGTLAIDMLSGSANPDFARVNPASSNLSAVRNNSVPGTVTFDPDVNYTVGQGPAGVTIADFNGDGKVDIANTNKDFNTFSVLLNNIGNTGPVITSFSPTSGTTGTVVTITGTNLTGVTAVSFGGVAAASFTLVNATTITATLGSGTSGNVSVTNPAGTASLGWFYFTPTITSFTPASAGFNVPVTITGTGFTGATSVSFGGIAAISFVILSPTTIVAKVSNGATGSVAVTTPGGTASLAGFVFAAPPTITSFTPTSGATGTVITITGTNFTGATQVNFGGTPASSFTVVNATTITAVVGTGSTGNVFVTTPGGTANMPGFTYNFPTSLGGPGSVNSPELTVFPNPGQENIYIQHPRSPNGKAYLRITDIFGRTILFTQPGRNDTQNIVRISKLSAGVYIIRWSDGKRELTRTFMKE